MTRVVLIALLSLAYALFLAYGGKPKYKAEMEIAFKTTEPLYRIKLIKLLENPLPLFLEDDVYFVTYDVNTVVESQNLAERVIEAGNFKERLYDPDDFPIF